VGISFKTVKTRKTAMNINREDAKSYVGPGWAPLIDAIYDRLPEDAHVLQVKEKWGGLRFYVDGTKELLDFIDEMEARSLEICEVCGQPGRPREGGWVRTLCDEHARVAVRENIMRAVSFSSRFKNRDELRALIEDLREQFDDLSPEEFESLVKEATQRTREEKTSSDTVEDD
jgi:hypothetical protein